MPVRSESLITTMNLSYRKVAFGGFDKNALLEKLNNADIKLNENADIIFSSALFSTSTSRKTASVVELTVNELGFQDGANLEEIKVRASELGLLECPMELAAYFRLQYVDQIEEVEIGKNKAPSGSVTVLSKPLVDSDDFPKGFYLRRIDGSLWLRGYKCDREYRWEPTDVFAFMVPEG